MNGLPPVFGWFANGACLRSWWEPYVYFIAEVSPDRRVLYSMRRKTEAEMLAADPEREMARALGYAEAPPLVLTEVAHNVGLLRAYDAHPEDPSVIERYSKTAKRKIAARGFDFVQIVYGGDE